MSFVESNMLFPFDANNAYRIEQADIVVNNENIKVCEFFTLNNGQLLLIEAKSSSPKNTNKIDFDEYIDEISQKFIDTLLLFNALSIGRHGNDEKNKLPDNINQISLASVKYAMYLIVHGNKEEWMNDINTALKLKLKHCLKVWNIPDANVYALNHETAKAKGLIRDFLPLNILTSFKNQGLKDTALKKEVEKWFEDKITIDK